MGAHRQDRGDLLADELYVEPKPYEYGVVGSQSISHSPYSADSHPSMRPPTAGSNQGYFGSSSPTHPLIPSSQDAHANANVQPQSQTQSRPLSPESVSARSGTARPVSPDGNFDYQHSSFSSAVLDGAERRLQVMNGDARDSMSIIAVTQGGQLDLHSPEGTAVGEGERRAEGSGSSLALASAGSGMKPRDLKSMRPSSSHVAGGTRSSKERDQAAVNRADDGRHLGDVMPPPAYEE
ncbi:hypothetical protein GYMLUDRAFT_557809 [Collybiopsis luxurians FD-317 M1]|uniref:Uncharacterized protein n=1 Tax=Collybiopsis luxurians FD-317 M1 TaxID=944289 RepID=A0A0D0CGT9_9AGAR|nr:hypothetical protein GYMLUDRAFT_557809 [Collybiopsis luxurians FD-317 M1]